MPEFLAWTEREFLAKLIASGRKDVLVRHLDRAIRATLYFPAETIDIKFAEFVVGINNAPLYIEIRLHVGDGPGQVRAEKLPLVIARLHEAIQPVLEKKGILPPGRYGIIVAPPNFHDHYQPVQNGDEIET